MYYGERIIYAVFHLWEMLLYHAVPIIYARIYLRILRMVYNNSELFQTRKQCYQGFYLRQYSFWWFIFDKSTAYKKTNKILNSSCSANHINFIDQNKNWIQMSGSLKPEPSEVTIWIIRLEGCCVMLLYNLTLTMDAHHGILSWVRPWKLNCKLIKESAYVFVWSFRLLVI